MEEKQESQPAGWYPLGETQDGWCKNLHGHYLVLLQSALGGDWHKWIDGNRRGYVENFGLAKQQLEREAAGEGSAWGIK